MAQAINSYGMSVEEMLESLTRDKVSITMFSPSFFGSVASNWHIELKKKDGGVALEVKDTECKELLIAVRTVFDKWHSMMDGNIRQHLGMPVLEHYETPPEIRGHSPNIAILDEVEEHPNALDKLHEEAGVRVKDDDIPF